MTAFEVIPVDTFGLDESRARVVSDLSYRELIAENRRLRADADVWHNAWATAVNNRVEDRERLSRAMRVLASLGRLSPRMAALIEVARREVWGELP